MSSSTEPPATGWFCFTADSAWANELEILDVMRNNSVEGKFEMPMTTDDGLTWYTDIYQLSTAFTTLGYYKPVDLDIGNGQTQTDLGTPRRVDLRYYERTWVTSVPKIVIRLNEGTNPTNVRVVIPTDTDEFRLAAEPAEWVDTDDDDAETDSRSRRARANKRSATVTRAVKMYLDQDGDFKSCKDDPKCKLAARVWIGEDAFDTEFWIDESLVGSFAVNGDQD